MGLRHTQPEIRRTQMYIEIKLGDVSHIYRLYDPYKLSDVLDKFNKSNHNTVSAGTMSYLLGFDKKEPPFYTEVIYHLIPYREKDFNLSTEELNEIIQELEDIFEDFNIGN